jgi:hypothetical protein
MLIDLCTTRLRIKAMEYAGLVGRVKNPFTALVFLLTLSEAMAVGRDVFRPDSGPLSELLILTYSTRLYSTVCGDGYQHDGLF